MLYFYHHYSFSDDKGMLRKHMFTAFKQDIFFQAINCLYNLSEVRYGYWK